MLRTVPQRRTAPLTPRPNPGLRDPIPSGLRPGPTRSRGLKAHGYRRLIATRCRMAPLARDPRLQVAGCRFGAAGTLDCWLEWAWLSNGKPSTLAAMSGCVFRPRTLARLLVCALLAAALSACVTDSERPRVRVGMSRDRLREYFGEPLRIEHVASGGEDWYYSFTGWSRPQVDGEAWRDPYDPNTSSVSVTVSSSRDTREYPVHLSAEGRVVEPIPSGRIAGN
jgi:hypothetical protein